MFTIENFSCEILTLIASQLEGKDIVNFLKVSRLFYSICDNVFWKNKLFQECSLQGCKDPKRKYFEHYFKYFTIIFLETCYTYEDSFQNFDNCSTDILLTNVSLNKVQALQNITKDLLPSPNISHIKPKLDMLNPSFTPGNYATLTSSQVKDLLMPTAPSNFVGRILNSNYSKNYIYRGIFVTREPFDPEYYKYCIFGKKLEIKGKTPPIITALIVTCVYNCHNLNEHEILRSIKLCVFVEYFESKEEGMKFINSDKIYNICNQLYYTDGKMSLRSNIKKYNKQIPYIRTQLTKWNSTHFYKKSMSSTSELCRRYSVDVFVEFVKIPVENNKTILSLQKDNDIIKNLIGPDG